MKAHIIINAIFLLSAFAYVYSVRAEDDVKIKAWHLAQLFEPASFQLLAEENRRMMINSGFKGDDVERVFDEHHEPIESMMFASVIASAKNLRRSKARQLTESFWKMINVNA